MSENTSEVRHTDERIDGIVFVCTGCGERMVQPSEGMRAHLVPTAHYHKNPSGFGGTWHDYEREVAS